MSKATLELSGDYIKFLLSGGNAFVNARDLLEDLTAEQATQSLSEHSHTIAEVIAHLNYWQDWFYAGATGRAKPYPDSGDESWPRVTAEDWDTLRRVFLEKLERIKDLCDDGDLLNRAFTEQSDMAGGHGERSVGQTLLYTVALHNGHHYGQIITLRQLMGLWPPQGGGIVW